MKKCGETRSRRHTATDEQPPIVQHLIDANDTIWSVAQLAAILGRSKWAVLKRIERGTIPAHKEGASWYILKSEYIAQLRKK